MIGLYVGTEVLVRGKVVRALGPGEAFVQTLYGNTVVERLTDLQLAESREGSVEERIERLARAMARADGCDPDAKAMVYEPVRYAHGLILGDDVFPAWRLYARYARAVVDGGLG